MKQRIIPCLDVADGRVVKGVRFVGLVDVGDPAELARRYEAEGADELVFLDIGASHEERETMLEMVRKTAEGLFIPLTVGGGIRSVDDMHRALRAGADKVAINTAVLKDPQLIRDGADRFGSQCVVVALDARRRDRHDPAAGWELYTHGGRQATGMDAIGFARTAAAMGAGELLVTSMDADGTADGYDVPLLQAMRAAVSVPIVASGGAGDATHVEEALRHVDAALLAGILHRGETTVQAIKAHLHDVGIEVRA